MSTVERGVEPVVQRSLSMLAAELADLGRRISEHRAFVTSLNACLRRRANLRQDQVDSAVKTTIHDGHDDAVCT